MPTPASHHSLAKRIISLLMAIIFTFGTILPAGNAYAQSVLTLPQPGTLVPLSPVFHPAVIKGMKIHPDNPLRFDFIIDSGHSGLEGESLKEESQKLIKYFLASLTIPEKNMWVNLSPYEKDKIISDDFGSTEMGRDLLAQDYLLKQITASMIYPEDDLGQKFWERVFQKAQRLYGTSDIPVNTFNKVWIVPERAVVYEEGDKVFVAESYLKVMLEQDYVALSAVRNQAESPLGDLAFENNSLGSSQSLQEESFSNPLVREIVLPELEREVNEGENFAGLRQIYHAMILATWFKESLKESFLGQNYVNQDKTNGIEQDDVAANQKIYEQYLKAFKLGVYNYIKEDYDESTDEMIPRKYFSGGVALDQLKVAATQSPLTPVHANGPVFIAPTEFGFLNTDSESTEADRAKLSKTEKNQEFWFSRLNGKQGDVRKQIFGENIDQWLEKHANQNGDISQREKAVKRLLKDKKFIQKIQSVPKSDTPLEIIRFAVKKDIYFGTRSLDIFLRLLRKDAANDIKKNIRTVTMPIKSFVELLESLALIQDYLDGEEFLSLDKEDRSAALVDEIRKRGLTLNNDHLGQIHSAMPDQISSRVTKKDVQMVELLERDFKKIRAALKDEDVQEYLDGEEFRSLVKEDRLPALVGAFQERGFILSNNHLRQFHSGLPKQINSQITKKDIPMVNMPMKVFDQIRTALDDEGLQEYFDEEEFQRLDKEDRLVALVDEIRRRGFKLESDNLGNIYSALPNQISPKVQKKDILKINLSRKVFDQIRTALADEGVQEYLDGDKFQSLDKEDRMVNLVEEIRERNFPLDDTSIKHLHTGLPRQISVKVKKEDVQVVHVSISVFEQVRAALKDKGVRAYLDGEEFQSLDKKDRLVALVDEIRKRGFKLESKNLVDIYSALPDQISPKVQKKDILKINLPMRVFDQIRIALTDEGVQEYLDSEEFQAIEKEDRLEALIEEIRERGFALDSEDLGHLFTIMPEQISLKVRKEDIPIVDLPTRVFDQIRVALVDEGVQEYFDSEEFQRLEKNDRIEALVGEIRKRDFLIDSIALGQVYAILLKNGKGDKRLNFFLDMIRIKGMANQWLFDFHQAFSIAKSYSPGSEEQTKEEIDWLRKQKNEEGEAVFNGRQIKAIIKTEGAFIEKRDLINDLMEAKIFNGAHIRRIVSGIGTIDQKRKFVAFLINEEIFSGYYISQLVSRRGDAFEEKEDLIKDLLEMDIFKSHHIYQIVKQTSTSEEKKELISYLVDKKVFNGASIGNILTSGASNEEKIEFIEELMSQGIFTPPQISRIISGGRTFEEKRRLLDYLVSKKSFSGHQMSRISTTGSSFEEIKAIVEYLQKQKDGEGRALFTGYYMMKVLESAKNFTKERFENVLSIFQGESVNRSILLSWVLPSNKYIEALLSAIDLPFEELSVEQLKERRTLLTSRAPPLDRDDVIALAEASLERKDYERVTAYIDQEIIKDQEELNRLIKDKEKLPDIDVVLRRLMLSFSLKIRKKTGDIVSEMLVQDILRAEGRFGHDAWDMFHDLFKGYRWYRVNAGFQNIKGNYRTSLKYMREYVYWKQVPQPYKSILEVIKRRKLKGFSEDEIDEHLMTVSGYTKTEIVGAKQYKRKRSLDKNFGDGKGTLHDVLPDVSFWGASSEEEEWEQTADEEVDWAQASGREVDQAARTADESKFTAQEFKKFRTSITRLTEILQKIDALPRNNKKEEKAKLLQRASKVIQPLARGGKSIFTPESAVSFAKKRGADKRLGLLLGVAKVKGIKNQWLFNLEQALSIAMNYPIGSEDRIMNEINWLKKQTDKDGKPLFSSNNIKAIIKKQGRFSEKKDFIVYLLGLEIFNAANIARVILSRSTVMELKEQIQYLIDQEIFTGTHISEIVASGAAFEQKKEVIQYLKETDIFNGGQISKIVYRSGTLEEKRRLIDYLVELNLFNGFQISQIVSKGDSFEDKDRLIQSLVEMKNGAGEPFFNGSQISRIVLSSHSFKEIETMIHELMKEEVFSGFDISEIVYSGGTVEEKEALIRHLTELNIFNGYHISRIVLSGAAFEVKAELIDDLIGLKVFNGAQISRIVYAGGAAQEKKEFIEHLISQDIFSGAHISEILLLGSDFADMRSLVDVLINQKVFDGRQITTILTQKTSLKEKEEFIRFLNEQKLFNGAQMIQMVLKEESFKEKKRQLQDLINRDLFNGAQINEIFNSQESFKEKMSFVDYLIRQKLFNASLISRIFSRKSPVEAKRDLIEYLVELHLFDAEQMVAIVVSRPTEENKKELIRFLVEKKIFNGQQIAEIVVRGGTNQKKQEFIEFLMKKDIFTGNHISQMIYRGETFEEKEELIEYLLNLGVFRGTQIQQIVSSSASMEDKKDLIEYLMEKKIFQGSHISQIIVNSDPINRKKTLIEDLLQRNIFNAHQISRIVYTKGSLEEKRELVEYLSGMHDFKGYQISQIVSGKGTVKEKKEFLEYLINKRMFSNRQISQVIYTGGATFEEKRQLIEELISQNIFNGFDMMQILYGSLSIVEKQELIQFLRDKEIFSGYHIGQIVIGRGHLEEKKRFIDGLIERGLFTAYQISQIVNSSGTIEAKNEMIDFLMNQKAAFSGSDMTQIISSRASLEEKKELIVYLLGKESFTTADIGIIVNNARTFNEKRETIEFLETKKLDFSGTEISRIVSNRADLEDKKKLINYLIEKDFFSSRHISLIVNSSGTFEQKKDVLEFLIKQKISFSGKEMSKIIANKVSLEEKKKTISYLIGKGLFSNSHISLIFSKEGALKEKIRIIEYLLGRQELIFSGFEMALIASTGSSFDEKRELIDYLADKKMFSSSQISRIVRSQGSLEDKREIVERLLQQKKYFSAFHITKILESKRSHKEKVEVISYLSEKEIFNTPQMIQIIKSSGTFKDKKELIEYLMNQRKADGEPLLKSSSIVRIISIKGHFKRSLFEKTKQIFHDVTVNDYTFSKWVLFPEKYAQRLKALIDRPFEDFPEEQIKGKRYLLEGLSFSLTQDHIRALARIYLTPKDFNKFESYLEEENKNDLKELGRLLEKKSDLPDIDFVLRRLMASFNLDIRNKAMAMVYEFLSFEIIAAERRFGHVASDIFTDFLESYDWGRENAGIANLKKNYQIRLTHRDTYIHMKKMPKEFQVIKGIMYRRLLKGQTWEEINAYLINRRGYTREEVASAKRFKVHSLDEELRQAPNAYGRPYTLYDIISGFQFISETEDDEEWSEWEKELEGKDAAQLAVVEELMSSLKGDFTPDEVKRLEEVMESIRFIQKKIEKLPTKDKRRGELKEEIANLLRPLTRGGKPLFLPKGTVILSKKSDLIKRLQFFQEISSMTDHNKAVLFQSSHLNKIIRLYGKGKEEGIKKQIRELLGPNAPQGDARFNGSQISVIIAKGGSWEERKKLLKYLSQVKDDHGEPIFSGSHMATIIYSGGDFLTKKNLIEHFKELRDADGERIFNGFNISEILRGGSSFEEKQELVDFLMAKSFFNGSQISQIVVSGASLEDKKKLANDLMKRKIFNGYQISRIMLSGGSLEEKENIIDNLIDLKDADGEALFNGSHIGQIVYSGSTYKEKERLINFLLKFDSFNGYSISQIVYSGDSVLEKEEFVKYLVSKIDHQGEKLFNGFQISQMIGNGTSINEKKELIEILINEDIFTGSQIAEIVFSSSSLEDKKEMLHYLTSFKTEAGEGFFNARPMSKIIAFSLSVKEKKRLIEDYRVKKDQNGQSLFNGSQISRIVTAKIKASVRESLLGYLMDKKIFNGAQISEIIAGKHTIKEKKRLTEYLIKKKIFNGAQISQIIASTGTVLEKENRVEYLLTLQNDDQRPLFNGYQVSQIFSTPGDYESKKKLLHYLRNLKDNNGHLYFNGANMTRIFRFMHLFDKKKFQNLKVIFDEVTLERNTLLNWLLLPEEYTQLLFTWMTKPFDELTEAELKKRWLLMVFAESSFDQDHAISLASHYLDSQNWKKFKEHVSREVAVDRKVLQELLAKNDIFIGMDDMIRRLMLSYSLDVREQTVSAIYNLLTPEIVKAQRKFGDDSNEIFLERLKMYNWSRPSAGLFNFKENFEILLRYKDVYLFWRNMPPEFRQISKTINRMERKGKSKEEIDTFLVKQRGFTEEEIAEARNFRIKSLDDKVWDGERTLHDVIAYEEAYSKLYDDYIEEIREKDPAQLSQEDFTAIDVEGHFSSTEWSQWAFTLDVIKKFSTIMEKLPPRDKRKKQKVVQEDIANILMSLTRDGKPLLKPKWATTFSKKRDVVDRLEFFRELASMTNRDGQVLFQPPQLYRIMRDYHIGREDRVQEEIRWLRSLKDEEGSPLFNSSHISQIVAKGESLEEKRKLISYLDEVRDENGKRMFIGYPISLIVYSGGTFDEKKALIEELKDARDFKWRKIFTGTSIAQIVLSGASFEEKMDFIRYLIQLPDDNQNPLLSGFQISKMVYQGGSIQAKRKAVELLISQKDDNGNLMFDGPAIVNTIQRMKFFDQKRFEDTRKAVEGSGVSFKTVLHWTLYAKEFKEMMMLWMEKPFASLSPEQIKERAGWIPFALSTIDQGHILALAEIYLDESDFRRFESFIRQEIALDQGYLANLKVLSKRDDALRRLMASFSLEVREKTMGIIYDLLLPDIIQMHKFYGDVSDDLFFESLMKYNWSRKNAGLENLKRNYQAILKHRDAYVFWMNLPPVVKDILQSIRLMEKRGRSQEYIENFLINKKGYTWDQVNAALSYGKGLSLDFNLEGRMSAHEVVSNGRIYNEFFEQVFEEEEDGEFPEIDSAQFNDVGGIDLNPQHMELERQGSGFDLNVPVPRDMESPSFDGLVPHIIQIIPVSNFNVLLGQSEEPVSGYDQMAYALN